MTDGPMGERTKLTLETARWDASQFRDEILRLRQELALHDAEDSERRELMPFKRMTLGELIAALRLLPEDAVVEGFHPEIFSYRGYYERNAVRKDEGYFNQAHVAARSLQEPIHGWKGGDYTVQHDELIYLVDSVSDTGPCFIGLAQNAENGRYRPVLLEEDWHF